jgi:deoxyribodipyrimidine photo-lyase
VQAGHGNVSRLSAGIRFRTLLEDEVIKETLAEHSFQVAEKWLQEVCWRRYWKGWLEMRPQVWTQWRQRVRSLPHQLPAETLVRAREVMSGDSGVACMDLIARELIDTGYIHNHARMWWASFWIHVEKLPWELGADFFFRHLLDADPASNTLSWRWVAGLQTPGKTYLVRLSNIEKYAPDYLSRNAAGSERLADGAVVASVVEDIGDLGKQPLAEYPTALGQTSKRTGLWLHPDDLTPEIGPLATLAPVSIAACVSDHVYSEIYQLSSQRIASLHTVLGYGLTRAAAHYACPSVALEASDPVAGLCSWVREYELAEVVAFAPMVGPIHDMLPRLSASLESMGTRLTLIRRASDAMAFSFATAGFFPFWEKMSRHLKQLPLS